MTIETSRLLELGLKRNGSKYTIDDIEVRYDGCWWYLGGQKIKDDIDLIKQEIENTHKEIQW